MPRRKKVYVIGSLCQEMAIMNIVNRISKTSDVRYVYKKSVKNFSEIASENFANIEWADVVIAVPQFDGTFSSGTSYEIEYAKRIGKRVIVAKKDWM